MHVDSYLDPAKWIGSDCQSAGHLNETPAQELIRLVIKKLHIGDNIRLLHYI